jgi:hypothetical protein
MLKGGYSALKISEGSLELLLIGLCVISAILFGLFATEGIYIPDDTGKLAAVLATGLVFASLLVCLVYIWRKPLRQGMALSYETTQKVMYVVLSTFSILFALFVTDTIDVSSSSGKAAALLGTALPILIALLYILYALWPVKSGATSAD